MLCLDLLFAFLVRDPFDGFSSERSSVASGSDQLTLVLFMPELHFSLFVFTVVYPGQWNVMLP